MLRRLNTCVGLTEYPYSLFRYLEVFRSRDTNKKCSTIDDGRDVSSIHDRAESNK